MRVDRTLRQDSFFVQRPTFGEASVGGSSCSGSQVAERISKNTNSPPSASASSQADRSRSNSPNASSRPMEKTSPNGWKRALSRVKRASTSATTTGQQSRFDSGGS
ncbi:unnamed protein product [Amoebophrya sp. A25]|nr:unnamed protein product [Amoebophrya sp. A25]|eukprot:GSA25T00021397001.1